MAEIIPINTPRQLVKAEALASVLQCSEATVLRMARSGKIPARKMGNGARILWRFNVEEVLNALDRQGATA